jgi:hypothetical protein
MLQSGPGILKNVPKWCLILTGPLLKSCVNCILMYFDVFERWVVLDIYINMLFFDPYSISTSEKNSYGFFQQYFIQVVSDVFISLKLVYIDCI